MSYASGTTHYNLPQTIGSDKRDWTDTNQAFADVDAALYAAAEGATSAASAISSIQSDITTIQGKQSTDEGNITTLQGKVATLESTVSGQTTEINDVRRDLQDNIESKHESTATSTHAYEIGDTFYYNDVLYKATAQIGIGDTIVPNTNCTGITVMSEIQSGAATPSAADVSYDNTTSGLTADDVQEAVDELASAVDDIDIRYTAANGAEWSPRGAGTWSPFSSGGLDPTDFAVRTSTTLVHNYDPTFDHIVPGSVFTLSMEAASSTGCDIQSVTGGTVRGSRLRPGEANQYAWIIDVDSNATSLEFNISNVGGSALSVGYGFFDNVA